LQQAKLADTRMQLRMTSSQDVRRIAGSIRLLMALLWFTATPLFAVTFTASVDRTSIVVGEQVTLTLRFEGGQPQQLSELPAIDGIRPASAVSQGVNSSMTPSGSTTIYTFSLALEATKPGTFIIPSFKAKAGGQDLTSQPITLKVAAEDSSGPPATYSSQPVFLWPALPKNELYVGEPVIGELRLYVRQGIRGISDPQLPLSGDGFNFSKLVKSSQYQRRVGSVGYTVISYSFAMTPVKAGNLTIGPISGSVILNPRDPMDFDSIFGTGRPSQQAALNMDAVAVSVKPLPTENVPADFTGAVGRYNLTVTAGPTNVAAGDPITLKIQISGFGQLDTINLPDRSDWSEFKVYPPTSKVETRDAFGIEGIKTFEQVVIPQNSEIKSLPTVSFSYFDPEQKSYRTLTRQAIPLTVRPGGSAVAPSIAANSGSKENSQPATQDVVPIKQRLGAVTKPSAPLIRQPWFLALQSIPAITLMGAVFWRRRNDSLANNPRLRRQRQVAQIVRDGLSQLRAQAAANDSDAFFATVFRLLQEQLGERLNVPAPSITEAVIEERLRPGGVSEATLTTLHELFQVCNLARYAPIKSSQELAAYIPKVESALRMAQEVKA
jgi:hypothetical protein